LIHSVEQLPFKRIHIAFLRCLRLRWSQFVEPEGLCLGPAVSSFHHIECFFKASIVCKQRKIARIQIGHLRKELLFRVRRWHLPKQRFQHVGTVSIQGLGFVAVTGFRGDRGFDREIPGDVIDLIWRLPVRIDRAIDRLHRIAVAALVFVCLSQSRADVIDAVPMC
jgi:hypothetical protein